MSPTRYREHDQIRHSYYTVEQYTLAQEWIRLNDDPATTILIRRWERRYPLLRGIQRPADILAAIDAGTPEVRDALLVTLIELFHLGQHLAGRIALQAMLPKLSAYAFRSAVTGRLDTRRADRFQRVLCEFWDVLIAYPVERRPTRVAANLAMETLHRLTEAEAHPEVPLDPSQISGLVDGRAERPSAEREVSSGWNLDELLAWAVRRKVVSAADARLLAEVYGETPGSSGSTRDVGAAYRTHAARTGTSPAALRQRTHRAKARLTIAVRTVLAGEVPRHVASPSVVSG
ncbi:MAG: hypothetical protein WAL50_18595 [Kineosporiaceae bacterium]